MPKVQLFPKPFSPSLRVEFRKEAIAMQVVFPCVCAPHLCSYAPSER